MEVSGMGWTEDWLSSTMCSCFLGEWNICTFLIYVHTTLWDVRVFYVFYAAKMVPTPNPFIVIADAMSTPTILDYSSVTKHEALKISQKRCFACFDKDMDMNAKMTNCCKNVIYTSRLTFFFPQPYSYICSILSLNLQKWITNLNINFNL